MAVNPFASVLTEGLATSGTPHESFQVLQEFCDGIALSTGKRAECTLERGHLVNYGQEWRPMLRSTRGGPPQLLFRAYIPLTDWPVMLDLREEALTRIENKEQLTEALHGFLRDPYVLEQIRYMMSFSSQPVSSSASG